MSESRHLEEARKLVRDFLKQESPECTCAEDIDSLCPVYNHVTNEEKLIQEIATALLSAEAKGMERAAVISDRWGNDAASKAIRAEAMKGTE